VNPPRRDAPHPLRPFHDEPGKRGSPDLKAWSTQTLMMRSCESAVFAPAVVPPTALRSKPGVSLVVARLELEKLGPVPFSPAQWYELGVDRQVRESELSSRVDLRIKHV